MRGFSLRRLPQSAWIFVAVFLLRLIALTRLTNSPSLNPTGGDVSFYHEWALRILAGEWTIGRAFYALPLYAYWLAGLYALTGVNAFVPGLVQCALDAATAVFMFEITRLALRDLGESKPKPVGSAEIFAALAAAAWAFYLPAQTFAIIRMPTALGVCATWFLAWQVVKRTEAPALRTPLFFGVLMGFVAMAVATILFMLPLLLGALVWKWRERSLRGVVALCAGIALGTAPCWMHNAFVARDPVFLSAHSGINFWIGNNATATGYPQFGEVRSGQAEMLRDSIAIAERDAGRTLQRSEVSHYWSARARAHIAAHPIRWLELLGRKVWNFWNAFQYDDLSIIEELREQGVTHPGFGFGLVAACAIAGLPFALRRKSPARWVFAVVLLQMISLLPVFVTERYRLPAVPGLIILGVLGLSLFWRNCFMRRWPSATAYIFVLVGAALLISVVPTAPGLWALVPYNVGRRALEAGDLETAQHKLERAHAYIPDNAEINLALGNLWLKRGDRGQARRFYQEAIAADPSHKSAWNNLGVLALEEGQFAAARDYILEASRREPENAKSHYLLAKALAGTGDRDGARLEIERALQLLPGQPEFLALEAELK